MSLSIPSVRAWRATLDTGERWLVWAPTKKLAVLNLRGAGCWRPVEKLARCQYFDRYPIPHSMARAATDAEAGPIARRS